MSSPHLLTPNPKPTITFTSPSEFTLAGAGVLAWRKGLGVFIPGAEFSPKYPEFWDGVQYPGRVTTTGQVILKRGLLGRALEDLDAVIVRPPEIAPHITPQLLATLRDYQQESLRLISERRWGRIALPTNAGKGAVIALAARAAAKSQLRVIILCDEIAVYQALEKEIVQWTGFEPDTLSADTEKLPSGAIVLAMVPTLHARTRPVKESAANGNAKKLRRRKKWIEWLSTFGVALLDEADKAAAPSWQSVLDYLKNTHYRIGFSGTFIPGEKSPQEVILSEYIGPVLLRLANIDLIERKISAKPLVEMVPFQHQVELPAKRIWYSMTGPERRAYVYDRYVIHNDRRHALIASLLDPNAPNAIIVNYIEHGRVLAASLPNAQFLYGEDDKDVRMAVLAQFKAGDFQNLVVSKILDRGTNELGHAVGLIFASSQGSLRQTLQRIGRGLRRSGGKEFLFLKDVMDSGHQYLTDQSTKRVQLYNSEGFEIVIRGPSLLETTTPPDP